MPVALSLIDQATIDKLFNILAYENGYTWDSFDGDIGAAVGNFATPNYTTAGRPAPASVPIGSLIYNTSTGQLQYSNGASWVALESLGAVTAIDVSFVPSVAGRWGVVPANVQAALDQIAAVGAAGSGSLLAGDLSGNLPNPVIAAGAVSAAKMAAGAAASNVGALGGALSGSLPNPSLAASSMGLLQVFTNAARPAANTFAAGQAIWNSTDKAPNFSDGTANWYDAVGNLT